MITQKQIRQHAEVFRQKEYPEYNNAATHSHFLLCASLNE